MYKANNEDNNDDHDFDDDEDDDEDEYESGQEYDQYMDPAQPRVWNLKHKKSFWKQLTIRDTYDLFKKIRALHDLFATISIFGLWNKLMCIPVYTHFCII